MGNLEGENGRPRTCPDMSDGRYTQNELFMYGGDAALWPLVIKYLYFYSSSICCCSLWTSLSQSIPAFDIYSVTIFCPFVILLVVSNSNDTNCKNHNLAGLDYSLVVISKYRNIFWCKIVQHNDQYDLGQWQQCPSDLWDSMTNIWKQKLVGKLLQIFRLPVTKLSNNDHKIWQFLQFCEGVIVIASCLL